MRRQLKIITVLRMIGAGLLLASTALSSSAQRLGTGTLAEAAGPRVVKKLLGKEKTGPNLLQPDRWRPWQLGFDRKGDVFICDNGQDTQAQRGVSQTVILNQKQPEPLLAVAWSKAEGVTGSPDSNYSLYLDLTYQDGTPLWGQIAPFATGTHDWQRVEVLVFPEKPVRAVSFHMLLRSHGGKAYFRDPALRVIRVPEFAALFDAVPVEVPSQIDEGFQLRDVAANSAYLRLEKQALGIRMDCRTYQKAGATFFDVTLRETTGRDRAVCLIYSIPVPPQGLRWFQDPRSTVDVLPMREYMNSTSWRCGSNGRLSRYPLGAVGTPTQGIALGIDMTQPAFFRTGYHAATRELFLAYDLGFAPEKPEAKLRFCRFEFDPKHGFRGALSRYYELFPEAFTVRVPKQGLWMPFFKISEVQGWEDFGFCFKEGNNETAWDDAHGIITFRYTEPMTWWMPMKPELPRTYQAALQEAKRLAEQKHRSALALFTSGFHNEQGEFPARFLDTPWCNGAVWSMNSMPGISGEVTDFRNKWSSQIIETLYIQKRGGELDGEYVDSSEGYVTDELDFRRDHFAAARTPLVFSRESGKPAIFRGLIVFEYVQAIAHDMHGMGKLMMANGTPGRLCWLVPYLDVLGTETDWHRNGRWSPMSDAELLYRRSLCKGKPYCFLMNTDFDQFSPELVERYMQRALAYGMFPGFFSPNASEGHYFSRPELYNRDRALFRRYVPLCKAVAEAGWEPITLAETDHPRVYVERFGQKYLTVFNDDRDQHTVTITYQGNPPVKSRELVSGQVLSWANGRTKLRLSPEEVAVIELMSEKD